MNRQNYNFEAYQSEYAAGLAKLGNELIAMRVGSKTTFEIDGYGPGSIWQKFERIKDETGMDFLPDGYANHGKTVIMKRVS